MEYADRGVHTVPLRFAPTVHATGGDHGFIALIARAARERGASAYVGDGTNRWTAVNGLDAGRLVALALDKAPGGSVVHAVAEEAVTSRTIAGDRGVPWTAGRLDPRRAGCRALRVDWLVLRPRHAGIGRPHPAASRLGAHPCDLGRGHRGRRLHLSGAPGA